jgi:hypothetical protein
LASKGGQLECCALIWLKSAFRQGTISHRLPADCNVLTLKVLVRESEGPVEHPINLGTAALKLVELKVTSKPAKPKMGKPGRKKKIAAVLEDLDDDGDAGPADGPDTAGECSQSIT